jgi:hypothetical protein
VNNVNIKKYPIAHTIDNEYEQYFITDVFESELKIGDCLLEKTPGISNNAS